ncbi:hypothetical protein [Pseudonocardia sp. MH-G8]|uniref:hypothetical protein n=1 Tax=Pseudonocardia sp. MH-G8 TaxID=1854588 RepID=UPI00117AA250|nr:hypothetical protein [Pseudonocardia sp. MH-G8]
MLTVSLLALGLAVLPVPTAADAPPDGGGCKVVDGAGRCLIEAADPARPGGPRAREPERERERPSPGRRDQDRSSAPPGSSAQGGQAPPAGAPQPDGGEAGEPVGEVEFTPPQDLVPPAVSPTVLAQRAIETLDLPAPAVRMSVSDLAFVGVPVWLWIDPGPQGTGPLSATATAGASQVTATARLVAVEWTMGPPGAEVRCPGTGTPWTGQPEPSPDCGYTYELRSLPERTGGTGRWPVVATGIWQVDWTGASGGTPVSGGQTVLLTAEQPLAVGEVQVLVDGGGG